MSDVVYDSSQIYIDSATSLREKIVRIDAIIDGLFTTALNAAATDNFTEYVLDDGQTKIRATYRGVESIKESIKSFETIKQLYVNRLNGRTFRLVPNSSFRRRY